MAKSDKKKKKHLHQITTTRAKDGSFVHEHHYKDKADDEATGNSVFGGTSQTMEDLHQHMDDNFGPQEQAQAEPDGDEQAAPAAAGGQPAEAE